MKLKTNIIIVSFVLSLIILIPYSSAEELSCWDLKKQIESDVNEVANLANKLESLGCDRRDQHGNPECEEIFMNVTISSMAIKASAKKWVNECYIPASNSFKPCIKFPNKDAIEFFTKGCRSRNCFNKYHICP